MVKVSILMPACNVERYIEECLDSVTAQTLRDIEIICINDGSSDSTGKILDEYSYRDSRIRVVHKPNSGYGHSMNVALGMAQGEYIGIVETDDFASEYMFESLYNAAAEADADVVKSNYYRYRSKPEPESRFFEVLSPTGKYDETFDPASHLDIFRVAPSIWTGIYKRSMLLENNISFNETPGASYQDTAFAFKVWASAGKVRLLREAFLHYRVDNDSSSVKSPGKVFCVCDEYREMERWLEAYPERKLRYEKIKNAIKYSTYRWNLNRLSFGFKYAFLVQMLSEFKNNEAEGLLEEELFRPNDWAELQKLLNSPNEYYEAKCCNVLKPYSTVEELKRKHDEDAVKLAGLQKQHDELKLHFNNMQNSQSFKLGRMITSIPRGLRDLVRK